MVALTLLAAWLLERSQPMQLLKTLSVERRRGVPHRPEPHEAVTACGLVSFGCVGATLGLARNAVLARWMILQKRHSARTDSGLFCHLLGVGYDVHVASETLRQRELSEGGS